MDLCIVTAFLDTGRDKWQAFSRNVHQYFENFAPYLAMGYRMVIYMDEKHCQRLFDMMGVSERINVVSIDAIWMGQNIKAYSDLSRELSIMNDDSFKKKISHRMHNPECCKPLYNIVQHSKIDFVCHAIDNDAVRSDYYAWSDFGYFQNKNRIPQKPLDLGLFDLNRINFQSMNDITVLDANMEWTLVNAPERIGGFFYMGSAENLKRYRDVYHLVVKEMYDRNIVDDDQHVMLRCVIREPELFKVWNLHQWHMVYLYFQQR